MHECMHAKVAYLVYTADRNGAHDFYTVTRVQLLITNLIVD